MVVVFLVDGSIVLKGNASYETNSIVLVLPVYIISDLKFNWNVHILVKLKCETDKKPDGQVAGIQSNVMKKKMPQTLLQQAFCKLKS